MFKIPMMAAVAAITLSSAIAHAQSPSTPSLAEVARQTAAKRASAKPATKVFTNASLAEPPADGTPLITSPTATPPATASTAVSQAPVTQPGSAPAADQATKPAEDENAWRQEAGRLRKDLDDARAALDSLRKTANATPAATEAQRRTAQRQLDQAQRTVEYFEKRWEQYRKEAAAAKIPPAWLEPGR